MRVLGTADPAVVPVAVYNEACLKPTRSDGFRKRGSFVHLFGGFGRRNSGTHEEEADCFPEFLSSFFLPNRKSWRVYALAQRGDWSSHRLRACWKRRFE